MTKRIENKGTLKRVFGVLVVLLVASVLLVGATSAAVSYKLPGDGTAESPFKLSTVEHLGIMQQAMASGSCTGNDGSQILNDSNIGVTSNRAHYILINDIDLKNVLWVPIAVFDGTLDGDGYKIQNLTISDSDKSVAFILSSHAETNAIIKDLTFENVNINGGGYGGSAVIFAEPMGPVKIQNCNVTGTIKISGGSFVGGLVGLVQGALSISDCSVEGTDETSEITGKGTVGGLVGLHANGADSIENCNVADITVSGEENVGGLVGSLNGCKDTAVISGCTATGDVTVSLKSGSTDDNLAVGGLIGRVVDLSGSEFASIEDCEFTGSITVDPSVSAGKVSTGLVGAALDYETDVNGEYNSQAIIDTLYGGTTPKVSDSTIILTPESAENLVSYYKDNNVDVNDKIVGDVSVKDSNNNVVLVTGLDQTIVADDGTTSTITWDNGAVSITGAETNAAGEILVGGTPVVKTDDMPLTSTDSTINVNVGSGTADDPYLIANEAQLRQLATDVNSGTLTPHNSAKYFKLIADIDLKNTAWTPIGNATNQFIGTFDGDNHTISNLKVTSTEWYAGLFGHAGTSEYGNAFFKNLKLYNVDVSSTGDRHTGSLVGSLIGSIENCHVSGVVKVSGGSFVGGLVGYSYASISDSTVVGDAGSEVTGTGESVGGLAGLVGEYRYTITDCTANIPVMGTAVVGGLIGGVNQGIEISDSSSSGSVTLTYANGHTYQEYEKSVGALAGRVGTSVEIISSSSTSDVKVDAEFANNNVDISAGFIGMVLGNSVNEQTDVESVTVSDDSTWKPSSASYAALKDAGYLKLEGMSDDFAVAEPVTPPVPSKPSSSSSSGSSVWLQEPATPTPTPTPTETVTPTDAVPTDIPVTQPTEEPSSPGFGVLAVLAGLGAVAVLRRK